MTNYGNSSTYVACLSTAISGSGTTAAPSGDILYMIIPKCTLNYSFMQKIKQIAGGSSYSNRDGKRKFGVNIPEVWVVKSDSAEFTFTAALNNYLLYIQAKHKTGAAKLYLFMQIESDNVIYGTVDLSGGHDWSGGSAKTFVLSYNGTPLTITLDANCANLAAVVSEINSAIVAQHGAGAFTVGTSASKYVTLNVNRGNNYTLAEGTGALAQLGWIAGTYPPKLYLSTTTAGVQQDYMAGYVTNFDVEITNSNFFVLKNFQFQECLT